MKMFKTIMALSLMGVVGVVSAADINSNGSQSTAAALNLQGQSTQTATSQGQQQGLSVGGGSAAGSGFGNDNSTNINNSRGSDLSKAVGNAFAPALTTTLTETCMGSTSVGGGFSGGSFSFGTRWRDSACVRRLDAREIKTFGDIQAAKEIMCDSDLVREAFQRVGRPCAADGGTYAAVSQPEALVAVPAAVEAPVATEKAVRDDQDSTAQRNKAILQKADEAREIMRAKGF